MAQTNYQGMGLYPMQEDKPPESFRDAMSKRMGLLQLGTGERPLLYGTKEGVGLYAGGGGTEPIYSGETGKPYEVASTQPVAAPTTPETPLGTAEWVNQEFKKKKDAYTEALKNQRLVIEKGKELGMPLEKVEAALKSRNLLKLKEPELSAPMLEILEEERKSKQPTGDITKTIETAEGIMQWNPETQRYDIKVGESKKTKQESGKSDEKIARIRQQGEVVTSKITEALEMIGKYGLTTTGLPGAIMSKIPGRDAYRLDNSLQTIKANIGFDELRKMRAESPTGGALGQVSEKEIDFLQNTLASLDLGIGTEDLISNLGQIDTIYKKVLNGIKEEEDRKKNEATTPSGVRRYNPSTGGFD